DDLRVSPPEGPFLEVTGHPVDIIVSRKSSGMEHLGKGERIDLALLPERVLFGSDSHKCSIVMNHDTLAVAATLVRHAKGACAFMIEGGKGSILSDGAEFEAAGGYTFRFRKK
ncbi:hypothetical protein KY363_07270, partial [Candidatus Woesearchaeota archaeon]|nr:hypothetical protein [Candidatus Woesearchaeota archaeon]